MYQLSKEQKQPGEMAGQGKVLAVRPNELSLHSGTTQWEEELTSTHCPLASTCPVWYLCTLYFHTSHPSKKEVNKFK